MAVEIKITGETAEKGYNELKQLATLIFGNRQETATTEPAPERPDPKPEKQTEAVEQPETSEQPEASVVIKLGIVTGKQIGRAHV